MHDKEKDRTTITISGNSKTAVQSPRREGPPKVTMGRPDSPRSKKKARRNKKKASNPSSNPKQGFGLRQVPDMNATFAGPKIDIDAYLDLSSRKCAKTGDIVQFYSTYTSMWLEQKDTFVPSDLAYSGVNFIMDDPFHSGVVVVRKGKVYLLQSLVRRNNKIGSGVDLDDFREAIGRRMNMGQKVQIRRLELEDRKYQAFKDRVDTFLKLVLHLPYKFPSFENLFKNLAARNTFLDMAKKFPNGELQNHDRDLVAKSRIAQKSGARDGLFCSELVSEFYLHLGIHPDFNHFKHEQLNIDDVLILPTTLDRFPKRLPRGGKLRGNITLMSSSTVEWREISPLMQLAFNIFEEMKKEQRGPLVIEI